LGARSELRLAGRTVREQAQSGIDLRQNGLEFGTLISADVIVLQPIKHLLLLSEKLIDRRHRGSPICARTGRCSARSRSVDNWSAACGSEPSLCCAPQRVHLKSISVSGRPRELVAAIGQAWQRGQAISIRSAVAMVKFPKQCWLSQVLNR
jgi:hypothetical protein